MLNRMKLRPKLILLFMLVGLVPMLVIAIISYDVAVNELHDQTIKRVQLFATQSQEIFESLFESYRNSAYVYAATRDIYQSLNVYYEDPEEWRLRNEDVVLPFLKVVKERYGYSGMFLCEQRGKIISSTNRSLLDKNVLISDYMQGALAGRVTVSKVFYSDEIREGVIVVSAPVRSGGEKGQIIGALCLFLNADLISEILTASLEQIGDSAEVFIINQYQILLTKPRFNKDLEILKTRIVTEETDELGAAIQAGNFDYAVIKRYRNDQGARVLGYLSVGMLGDNPAGFVLQIDEDEVFSATDKLRNTIIILAVFIILGTVILGIISASSFAKPILKIKSNLQKIAAGDLTSFVEIKRGDEIGEMARELNIAVEKFSNIIRHVIQSADQVENASRQIAAGNQDLSQRTQEQASTLEEVAATMEEVNASIQQTAANSDQADQLAQNTLEVVKEGERATRETIDAMAQISASSKQIAEIIRVVNDIAFQTNLLALNAAVEAARAGEQGRGFAVVAAEVRNLAGRTAESAKEIEALIRESVERTDRGNLLVKKSAEILEQIVANTKRASDVIIEVAAAMREQAGASQQVQAATDQLNQVTQENAAMVEEISASSQTLHAEAENLRDVVSMIKVNSDAGDPDIAESREMEVSGEDKNGEPASQQPPAHETNGFTQDSLEDF
ncbi:MAG: HAMP domain-containing protein [Firmicutes bacterium]|nr:HAMP domain-containing protein [Bacillota bacterium]